MVIKLQIQFFYIIVIARQYTGGQALSLVAVFSDFGGGGGGGGWNLYRKHKKGKPKKYERPYYGLLQLFSLFV